MWQHTCVKGYKSIRITQKRAYMHLILSEVRLSFHILTSTHIKMRWIPILSQFFFSLATFTTHSIQLILRMWTYVHLFALASAFFSFQFGSYKSHLSIFFLVIFSFICTFKQFFCVFSWDRKWATEWTNEQTFSSALHTHTNVI